MRPRSRALLHRRQVPFSGRKRCITLLSQHFCHRCGTRSNASAHVWKTRVPVGDPAHSNRVMIAPRQQTCARRRAQCSGVKARVTQTVLREPVDVGCWNGTAKTTWVRKTHVIKNNGDHIGPAKALRQIRPCGSRCLIRVGNGAREVGFARVFLSVHDSPSAPYLHWDKFSHSVCK